MNNFSEDPLKGEDFYYFFSRSLNILPFHAFIQGPLGLQWSRIMLLSEISNLI